MHTLLHFKNKKFIRNRKGFATIVGSIFAVLIALSLASTLFVWSLSQNTLYNDAVGVKSQLIANQLNEDLKAYGANYDTSQSGFVGVSALMQNQGGITVTFVRLFVADKNGLTSQAAPDPTITLIPGQISQTPEIFVPIPAGFDTTNMSSWFITQRGNMVSTMLGGGGEPGPSGPQGIQGGQAYNAMTAQGIGSIAMNFSTFTHWEFSALTPNGINLNTAAIYPNNYTITSGKSIVFNITLINLDPGRQDITLDGNSSIFMLGPNKGGSGAAQWGVWMLGSINPDGTFNTNPNIALTLNFNQTKSFYFWCDTKATSNIMTGAIYPLNIILHGTKNNNDYGQNLPFVSVYLQ